MKAILFMNTVTQWSLLCRYSLNCRTSEIVPMSYFVYYDACLFVFCS